LQSPESLILRRAVCCKFISRGSTILVLLVRAAGDVLPLENMLFLSL
jgi:hypothetical protein